MRKALICVHGENAGVLEELGVNNYLFSYDDGYQGAPISLTMPVAQKHYRFERFPPFFEGLLPEGMMLEALLRKYKLDRSDHFSQLLMVGQDVVGAVTIEEVQ